MELRNVCEDILEDVEGSLGCAAIDLETGSTLAAACRSDTLDPRGVGVISVAVSEMFHGKLIRQFHRAWSGGAAAPERFVREVQMATANSYQFMSVVPGWDDCLLVLITDRSVSLGLGWMAVHQGLSRIAELPRPDAPPARTPPVRTAPRVAAPRRPAAEARPRPPEPPRPPAPTPPSREADAGAQAPAAAPPPPEPTRPTPAAPAAPAAPDSAPPPAGRRPAPRQRTYRGVPVGKAEPPSEDEQDVPMGPRGRMFTPRR